jgi:hypothetical protein
MEEEKKILDFESRRYLVKLLYRDCLPAWSVNGCGCSIGVNRTIEQRQSGP